jgi:hypothetical protein
MMKMKILSVLALSAGLVACGGDSSPSVPTRDELVAQIVDAGGVDQVVAECAADALFSNLTEADLNAVVAGGDPSEEAQTAFTNAVLDCLSETVITEPPSTDAPIVGAEFSQWASNAFATSQYGVTSWSASRATGEPDVVDCGDNGMAWAPSTTNEVATLTVQFGTPVVPSEINVVQSYNPGTITSIEVVDVNGDSTVVYSGVPKVGADCPAASAFPVTGVTTAVDEVNITIDETVLDLGWSEVDAVQLVGIAK